MKESHRKFKSMEIKRGKINFGRKESRLLPLPKLKVEKIKISDLEINTGKNQSVALFKSEDSSYIPDFKSFRNNSRNLKKSSNFPKLSVRGQNYLAGSLNFFVNLRPRRKKMKRKKNIFWKKKLKKVKSGEKKKDECSDPQRIANRLKQHQKMPIHCKHVKVKQGKRDLKKFLFEDSRHIMTLATPKKMVLVQYKKKSEEENYVLPCTKNAFYSGRFYRKRLKNKKSIIS